MVEGLELGADDYMKKPSPRRSSACVKASSEGGPPEEPQVGGRDLRIEVDGDTAFCGDP